MIFPWFRRDAASAEPIGPKLARNSATIIDWQASNAAVPDAAPTEWRSPDGYWRIERVVSFHLLRQGVDLGPYPELEQAQARAELDNIGRTVCRGSGMAPWRAREFPTAVYGECMVCGAGGVQVVEGRVVDHVTFKREWQRPVGR